MIPGQFEYHRPQSTGEVLSLLEKFGDTGRVIAGGHSLLPMMKLRLAVPEHLIDLGGLTELKGISVDSSTIKIGAMTTQHELIDSGELHESCPIIREAALQIADPQVRYCGTIGGNVANGDPGNDMPALMQCLNATYRLESGSGSREVAARDFYEAAYFTELKEGELLTAVTIPVPATGHGYSYIKMKRKVGDFATAAAGVILTIKGGTCTDASIALTNVADTPLHAREASEKLIGTGIDDEAVNAAVSSAEAICDPVSDARGPAEYRTKMAGHMVRRAIAAAIERAEK